jgi:hypothetical protein
MSSPVPDSVPPGAPVVPQGPVPAVGIPNSQDYPRLVYTAPRFEVVAIADIIAPSVLEACEALLPSLVPPYVDAAADAAVASLAVVLTGSTMSGPLNLSPTMPTAPAMAATKAYVDSMIGTVIPEVPPVPVGQAWARETGQWIPLAGGGTVTNIATGAGLTGGPITATGTIAMANMAANSLKGNNTATVTAPTDLNVGQVMTMLGAAPLNSPNFVGTPTLPTGTQAITQPGGTNNTSVATTAFVATSITTATAAYVPLTGNVTVTGPLAMTGALSTLTLNANAVNALHAVPLQQLTSVVGAYLPLTGGTLTGPLTAPNYQGTTTNNNAASGAIGEYQTGSFSGGALATGTPASTANVSLTAGDWDVWGAAVITPSAGAQAIEVGVSTTNNAFSGALDAGGNTLLQAAFLAGGAQRLNTAAARISIAATTTVYLIAQANFTTGTCSVGGFISARRVR